MKLVSYIKEGHEQLAILVNDILYDTDGLHPELPSTMSMFLNYWDDYYTLAVAINQSIQDGKISLNKGIPLGSASLLSPVPQPSSCRDADGFSSESKEFPVLSFCNHHSIQGPGEIYCMPDHLQDLDFELKVAIVICRQGKNISADEADEYIGGYMIMNDVCARRLEKEEMQFNRGPVKSKDFATVVGPWLVTSDELELFRTETKDGHLGNCFQLSMKCRVNGKQVSEGNLADMRWTFAEIIERSAYGAELFPGEIVSSGTFANGSLQGLNSIGGPNDSSYQPQWLCEGDTIEMEIEGLGTLVTNVVADPNDFSLRAKRKNRE
ncbi:MAG: fumarylacetoacetate hydrolase family protein [Chitinophagaceae bacterium]